MSTRRARSGLNGNKWRMSHQATVDAILSPIGEHHTVRSRGAMFYNVDHWTARQLLATVCEWSKLNPGIRPDEATVRHWVAVANTPPSDRYGYAKEFGITIGQTPDDLPIWLAMALIGGGYHEAWHTEYSCRRPLTFEEVWAMINQLWDLIPYAPDKGRRGWAGLTGPLLEWSNIIEDIRIERNGCRKYPGSGDKMISLQDLILKQEEEGRTIAEHKGLPSNKDLAAVTGTFRDLGLGYESPRQRAALLRYEVDSPKGVAFVKEGALRPLLDATIALGPEDDLGCIWLAMRVLGAISDADTGAAQPQPPQPRGPTNPGPTPPGPTNPGPGGSPPPGGGGVPDPNAKKVWVVGDRATMKRGPYKGREVEVTWAGIPDEDGKQELRYALIEPDLS